MLAEEGFTPILATEACNEIVHVLIVEVLRYQRQIRWRDAFHFGLEQMFEQSQVFHNGIDHVAIERQCLFQFVKDTHKVQHQPVRFAPLIAMIRKSSPASFKLLIYIENSTILLSQNFVVIKS